MKNKNLIIGIILLTVLITTTAAYAWGDYFMYCFGDGQAYPPPSSTRNCKVECCKVCAQHNETGAVWVAPLGKCNDIGADCQCGDIDNDFKGPNVTISAPRNESVHAKKAIRMVIKTDEKADYFLYDNANARKGWQRICTDCLTYNRDRTFAEGENNYQFKAVDEHGNPTIVGFVIYVDTNAPKIKKTYPAKGAFTGGTFTVEYDELNLIQTTLYYKPEGSASYLSKSRTDCPDGKGQKCDISVTGLPDGNVEYYFTIKDIATQTATSDKVIVGVDTSIPTIRLTPFGQACGKAYLCVGDKKYKFNVTVTNSEKALIEYIDYADNSPKWKMLCKDCNSFQDETSFNDGIHNVTVRASDKAGNKDSKRVEFLIDSKEPTIKSTSPLKNEYTNKNFTVGYGEQNLEAVTFYWKFPGQTSFSEKQVTNCPKGNNECQVSLDTPNKDSVVTYYFGIRDPITAVYSKEITTNFDNIVPVITVKTPANSANYNNKTVMFEVNMSEEVVTLEYIDNADVRPAYKKLCTKCDSFKKAVTLRQGSHAIVFRATDKAENVGKTSQISFTS